MTKPILEILVPISLGELIDKITILQIKSRHLQGTAKVNVENELKALEKILKRHEIDINEELVKELIKVNEELWKIEDDIRELERRKVFDQNFINLARSVYVTNDQRAVIKKRINIIYGSALIEEKSYQSYQ